MLTTIVEAEISRLLQLHKELSAIDLDSLRSIVEDEIFAVLQPILLTTESAKKNSGGSRKYENSFNCLAEISRKRVDNIGIVLLSALEASTTYNQEAQKEYIALPLVFKALAGDSHNGGLRPLLIMKNGKSAVVLKFADPRPYQVMAEILQALSRAIGLDLVPPSIFLDQKNRWYFIEYLEERNNEENISQTHIDTFMFGMGAMTAVAFSLGFVDLHLENIIAVGNKPIIIDPECIFYNFDGDTVISEKLLSTGLLSHNIHMSSLRGGGTDEVPLHDFSMYMAKDGVLRYRKPVRPHRNRIRQADGSFADPANYQHHVISGYCAAYKWFIKNADAVCSSIEKYVEDDFRIRFLARKTRHYASVIYMLNLPNAENYRGWVDQIFKRFRESGYFPSSMPEAFIAAELRDLENRDIPYFWVTAGGKGSIEHRTGIVHQLDIGKSPRERATYDIQMLHTLDLNEQVSVLEGFLKMDLSLPIAA
jgi:lantibiotic modifying enzyme